MATFNVGQRVRIVRNVFDDPKTIGMQATVLSEIFVDDDADAVYWIRPDRHSVCRASPNELEPIQPERNQVIEWSECLWQPEREGSTA